MKKICKHCGKSFRDIKGNMGKVCKSCNDKYRRGIYKRKAQTGEPREPKYRKVLTPEECKDFIITIKKRHGMATLYDLSKLIDVFFCMKGKDENISEWSGGRQLTYMWNYVKNIY
jgi:hypothetical protein